MKKVIGLFVLSLVLFGCNESEKKVTPEMLVGDWVCDGSSPEAKWRNGVFQDFDTPKPEKARVTFKVENNEVFMQPYERNDWIPLSLNDYYDKKYEEQYSQQFGIKTKITREITYISKDSFKTELINETTYDKSNNSGENSHFKVKVIMNCTRIK